MISQEEFVAAVKAGDAERVKQMLAREPKLAAARDANGTSAALTAVYYHHPAVAELIVERGVRLDVFEAAALGRIETVREHLKSDPALANACAPDGFFPLGLAAFFGHADVVELLLAHGADVNAAARNEMRVAALHAATSGSHTAIAARLLAAGADPNARQQQGWQPLHGAAASGRVALVKVLLAHGADPAATTDAGETPTALARKHGHDEVAALLEVPAG